MKGKSHSKNAHLADFLIKNSLSNASKSNLPIYHIDENNQLGTTFGEKIANAFEEVFAQGYQSVICVGNDAADLSDINWVGLTSSLERGQNVLGRDFRNGAYLIGLTKHSFRKDAFEQLRWQSKYLYDDLFEYTGSCQELTQKHDLNNWHDLKCASRVYRHLKNILKSILQSPFTIPASEPIIKTSIRLSFGLRAPPFPI